MEVIDWGILDYKEAWDKQEATFREQLDRKKNGLPTTNRLILVEHPHVYTLGKSGNRNNLLITDEFLQKIGASFYQINRGGDITYHGPGQIVGYPILDLETFGISLKEYIHRLEEVIIRLLKEEFGIEAHRSAGATGVWLGEGSSERKICAIGTRSSRYITMHGFAFNVNTDLSYFGYINPCGFRDRSVTSLEKETGIAHDLSAIKEKLVSCFRSVFNE
jgi:lipoyl(octanoyl) transferase